MLHVQIAEPNKEYLAKKEETFSNPSEFVRDVERISYLGMRELAQSVWLLLQSSEKEVYRI